MAQFSVNFDAAVLTRGSEAVVRFYVKSLDDKAAGENSLSLVVPANLANAYYDTQGRRIQITVED